MFKVVRKDAHGRLLSCATENPKLVVEYRPSLWTEARIGGLLVFMDYSAAEIFAGAVSIGTTESFEIWLREVSDQVRLPEFSLTRTDRTDAVELLWRSKDVRAIKHLIRPARLEFWPEGTVAYRRVKLIERAEKQ